MKYKEVLGIDFGGSGIKGAPVDVKKGILLEERHRIPTPQPAEPDGVIREINNLVKFFNWKGPIGIGFPSVVQHGIIKTASNIDDSWIGVNATERISKQTSCPTFVLNDADAAGMAEMKYGAGKKNKGVVLLITVGSGIGTVVFTNKKLVPNLEWGHVYMPKDIESEEYVSDAVRKKLDLSWEDWAKRFNEYLCYINQLLWSDLIIIGGGVSKEKKFSKFEDILTVDTKVVPAELMNNAGLIGAARAAAKALK